MTRKHSNKRVRQACLVRKKWRKISILFSPIWADLRGQSCKKIQRSQCKSYWTLHSNKWTVPKPIWFDILSAQLCENVIWKSLKLANPPKSHGTKICTLAKDITSYPESFIMWIQFDRISDNLHKSKNAENWQEVGKITCTSYPKFDTGIVMQISQKQGGVWNHIRKVICCRNLKVIG